VCCFAELGMDYKGEAVCERADTTLVSFIVTGEY
jgi:hypothetical protein